MSQHGIEDVWAQPLHSLEALPLEGGMGGTTREALAEVGLAVSKYTAALPSALHLHPTNANTRTTYAWFYTRQERGAWSHTHGHSPVFASFPIHPLSSARMHRGRRYRRVDGQAT